MEDITLNEQDIDFDINDQEELAKQKRIEQLEEENKKMQFVF